MALIRANSSTTGLDLADNTLQEIGSGATTINFTAGTPATISLINYVNRSFIFKSVGYTNAHYSPNAGLKVGVTVFKNGEIIKNSSVEVTATSGTDIDITGGDFVIFTILNNTSGLANNSTLTIS